MYFLPDRALASVVELRAAQAPGEEQVHLAVYAGVQGHASFYQIVTDKIGKKKRGKCATRDNLTRKVRILFSECQLLQHHG